MRSFTKSVATIRSPSASQCLECACTVNLFAHSSYTKDDKSTVGDVTTQWAPSLPPSPHPPLFSLSCSPSQDCFRIASAAGNRVNNCPANGELAASLPFTTDCSLAGKQEDVVEVSHPVSVRPPIAREDPGVPPPVNTPTHLPASPLTLHSRTPQHNTYTTTNTHIHTLTHTRTPNTHTHKHTHTHSSRFGARLATPTSRAERRGAVLQPCLPSP